MTRIDPWLSPRPHTDAGTRLRKHGPVLPMDGSPKTPGSFARGAALATPFAIVAWSAFAWLAH